MSILPIGSICCPNCHTSAKNFVILRQKDINFKNQVTSPMGMTELNIFAICPMCKSILSQPRIACHLPIGWSNITNLSINHLSFITKFKIMIYKIKIKIFKC